MEQDHSGEGETANAVEFGQVAALRQTPLQERLPTLVGFHVRGAQVPSPVSIQRHILAGVSAAILMTPLAGRMQLHHSLSSRVNRRILVVCARQVLETVFCDYCSGYAAKSSWSVV